MSKPNFLQRLFTLKKDGEAPSKSAIMDLVYRQEYKSVKDIKAWRSAEQTALAEYEPRYDMLMNLYHNCMKDGLLSSQIQNRKFQAFGRKWAIFSGEKENEKAKEIVLPLVKDINNAILDSTYFGHTLMQFEQYGDTYAVDVVPRQNVVPRTGDVFTDLTTLDKKSYINMPEYGTWLISFRGEEKLGLLSKIMPYYLFKVFALSCWSQMSEIYGIPPRVLQTDMKNEAARRRLEDMYKKAGAALWQLIDKDENMIFGNSSTAMNGDVFKNLIAQCNNEIALCITGAIIGQDTKHGSYSKEESSKDLLSMIIDSDCQQIATEWNTTVLPAMQGIGMLPAGNYTFKYLPSDNVEVLWDRVKDTMPHYDIPAKWLLEKFGIEVDSSKKAEKEKSDLSFF